MSKRTHKQETKQMEHVLRFVSIDFESGVVTWSARRGGTQPGKKFGNVLRKAHTSYRGSVVRINHNRVWISAHRLVFYAYHRTLPECVDHIDGNGLNNSISNLRGATHSENIRNRQHLHVKNSTGHHGLTKYISRVGKPDTWNASIGVNNKSVYLGTFASFKEAKVARLAAEALYFGRFAPSHKI